MPHCTVTLRDTADGKRVGMLLQLEEMLSPAQGRTAAKILGMREVSSGIITPHHRGSLTMSLSEMESSRETRRRSGREKKYFGRGFLDKLYAPQRGELHSEFQEAWGTHARRESEGGRKRGEEIEVSS